MVSIAYFVPTLLSLFIVGFNIVYFIMTVLSMVSGMKF